MSRVSSPVPHVYANMAFDISTKSDGGPSWHPFSLFSYACLSAPLAMSAQGNPNWTSLVEAERAFAAASLAKGTRAAFLSSWLRIPFSFGLVLCRQEMD